MKNFMLSICLFALNMLQCAAQETTIVNAIRYNVNDSTASVSCQLKNLVGDIAIPEYIEYKGKKYKVMGIEENAFRGTNISSIDLSSSIVHIAGTSFVDCKKLSKVITHWNDSVPLFEKEVFASLPKNAILFIPRNTSGLYASREWVASFSQVVESTGTVSSTAPQSAMSKVDKKKIGAKAFENWRKITKSTLVHP